MKTIKCNPTWEWATAAYIYILKESTSPEAKKHAEDELFRMARAYDAMLKKHTDYFDNTETDDGN